MTEKVKTGACSVGMLGVELSLFHQNLQVVFNYGISVTKMLAWHNFIPEKCLFHFPRELCMVSG